MAMIWFKENGLERLQSRFLYKGIFQDEWRPLSDETERPSKKERKKKRGKKKFEVNVSVPAVLCNIGGFTVTRLRRIVERFPPFAA